MSDPLNPWYLPIPGVAAHRGGKAVGPENTMVAISRGLAAGATHIELDVRGTSDGEAVCMHDETARRTCKDPVAIADIPLSHVQELDPCALWSEHAGIATGEHPPPAGMSPAWFRVPTLIEVLRTFRGVPVILDLKETAPVEAVVEAVSNWRGAHDVLIGGFDDELIDAVASELPGVPVAAGEQAARAFFSGETPEVDAIVVPLEHEGVSLVDVEWVEQAHANDIAFWVWTINELETARELFSIGVDGIVTDDPGKMSRERIRRIQAL